LSSEEGVGKKASVNFEDPNSLLEAKVKRNKKKAGGLAIGRVAVKREKRTPKKNSK